MKVYFHNAKCKMKNGKWKTLLSVGGGKEKFALCTLHFEMFAKQTKEVL